MYEAVRATPPPDPATEPATPQVAAQITATPTPPAEEEIAPGTSPRADDTVTVSGQSGHGVVDEVLPDGRLVVTPGSPAAAAAATVVQAFPAPARPVAGSTPPAPTAAPARSTAPTAQREHDTAR